MSISVTIPLTAENFAAAVATGLIPADQVVGYARRLSGCGALAVRAIATAPVDPPDVPSPDDLRAAAIAIPGEAEGLQRLLKRFGVTTLNQLPANKRAEFIAACAVETAGATT